tara:strand:+ start:1369 stop:1632 length:264 start_codon:yes stop_codon:yes gene_type:complete
MSPPTNHVELHSSEQLTTEIELMWKRIGNVKEFMKSTIRNSSSSEEVEQERIDRIDNTKCPIDMLRHTSLLIHMLEMYFDQIEEEKD